VSPSPYYPPIIGISGGFESGKDAVGSILVRTYGYTRVAFGDFVRDACFDLVNGRSCPDDFPDEIQKIIFEHRRNTCAVFAKPTTPPMRRLLQFVGTDYYRELDQHHWVNLFDNYARPIFRNGGRVVAPDMRFDNEGAYVVSQQGSEWQVVRPGLAAAEHRDHISEHSYTRVPAVILRNDGPLGQLETRVIEALQTTQDLHLQAAA
jgi:hypothetical protein